MIPDSNPHYKRVPFLRSFQVIAHHAQYDYAERIFVQTYPTLRTKTIKAAPGIWLTLQNGQKILDATSGAAVSAIGRGNADVTKAIFTQLD